MAETPLETVPGWSREHVERLKEAWITTAEQVVGMSGTSGGVRSLAQHLGVTEDEAASLVESARAHLAPRLRAQLSRPADTSNFGLGARRPEEGETA